MAESGNPATATSALPSFEIEITRQGWITSEPDSVREDLCSHGDIRLVIGGYILAPGDGTGDYTISTSALALLRTLESDHSPEQPVGASHLILCCGMLLMTSCPAGINWWVEHCRGRVRLSGFAGPRLVVELSEDEYRRRIVAFAEKAKEPFAGIEKLFADDDDRQLYEEFWEEYEVRLSRAVQQSHG